MSPPTCGDATSSTRLLVRRLACGWDVCKTLASHEIQRSDVGLHKRKALPGAARSPPSYRMSGLEVFGAVATALTCVSSAVLCVDQLHAALQLSKKNAPLCAALDEKLASLRLYLEEKQRAQRLELENLGGLWGGTVLQIANDLAAIAKDLEELAGMKSRSKLKARLVEMKNAADVAAVLEAADVKLGLAWSKLLAVDVGERLQQSAGEVSDRFDRLESRDEDARRERGALLEAVADLTSLLRSPEKQLTVIERVVCQPDEAVSMESVASFVQEELDLATTAVSVAGLSFSGIVQSEGLPGARQSLTVDVDYEAGRKRLEDLQPRVVDFVRRLERGSLGARLSAEEKADLMTVLEELWMELRQVNGDI